MTRAFAITLAATLGIAAFSGVTLGRFVITQPRVLPESNSVMAQVGNPDAAYGPAPATLSAADGPAAIPTCKGCGPTLAQRRMDRDYSDAYADFASDPAIVNITTYASDDGGEAAKSDALQ